MARNLCRAPGCDKDVHHGVFMCRPHRQMIPKKLRVDVWEAKLNWRQDEYERLLAEAIALVVAKESEARI